MKSHILPEFMYQNVYDKTPKRFYSLSIKLTDYSKSSKKVEQKGIREYLFCNQCEQLLNKHETYAANVLYSKNRKSKNYIQNAYKIHNHELSIFECAGLTYKPIKLFLLSLFWRILISETFTETNGEEIMNEKLRLALLSEEPLAYDEFGCIIQHLRYNKEQVVSQIILSPYLTESKDSSILNLLVDGFIYSFYFTSEKCASNVKSFFLNEDGSMRIIGRMVFNDPHLFGKIRKAFQFYDEPKK